MTSDRDPLEGIEFENLTDSADMEFRLASTQNEAIDAGGGDDIILTGSGNDVIKGGEGNDYISAGAGNDIISGGAGSNILSGGSGMDTFLFDACDLGDPATPTVTTITDFNPEEDTLKLLGFGFSSFSDLPAFVSPTGVMLQLAPGKVVLLQGVTSLDALRPAVDLGTNDPSPPVVTFGLANDTGGPGDGITNDVSLSGTVTGDAPIVSLYVSVDGGAEVDVSDALAADGSFLIDPADLFELEDGDYDFSIRAEDETGTSSEATTFSAVLDSAAPALGDVGLAPESDTGVQGDGQTDLRSVTLVGTSEAGAVIRAAGLETVADEIGAFSLSGVPVSVGQNDIPVTSTDSAGNVSEVLFQVVGTEPTAPPVIQVALSEDTGVDGDKVSSDVSLSGTVSGDAPIVSLFVSDDGGAEVDVSDALAADGSFLIDPAELFELEDGDYNFSIRAEDETGTSSEVTTFSAVLDSEAPALGDVGLAPESDTGVQGDGQTDLRSVTLVGTSEAGAVIRAAGLETVADEIGAFSLSGVPVSVGQNDIPVTSTDSAGNVSEVLFQVVGTEPTEAPDVTGLGLKSDSGSSDVDLLTNDPSLIGAVSDGDIAKLLVTINGSGPHDVTTLLSNGGFEIGLEALEQAIGSPLADGSFEVNVVAENSAGQQGDAGSLTFELDRNVVPVSEVGLAASSDTGVRGDGITALRSVRLTGEGEPGATVAAEGKSTIVSVDGSFTLDGVPVSEGANQISLVTTDMAGNTASSVLEVTGIAGVDGQPVLLWNDITLEAIADNAEGATGASRILAMQSVAVHDVIAALDNAPAFLVNETAVDGADLAAAVAQASYVVLSYAFPAFQKELDAYLAEVLEDVPDGSGEDAGIALGQAVAERLIAIRDADGWNDFEILPGSEVPGEWRETGPNFEPAIDQQWATMTTWALDDAEQFRAEAPLDLSSAEYAEAVNEVKEIGSADSQIRTADQTEAARFWKDGRGTETTPGHWNSIATDLMKDEGSSSSEAARALAMLNVSVADAMIAAWDTKYTYTYWRPEDAIRLADTDGNAATDADPEWQPLMLAPAHPEYVSGHAAASGAAAEILTELYGTYSFTTESLGLAGIERSFDTFWQAAQENADSRLWGGVHYEFSNQNGLDIGADVAQWAIDAFNNQTDSSAPTIIVDTILSYTGQLPFEITGAALDTLSGVAGLTATIADEDASTEDVVRSINLDENGGFSVTFEDGLADGTYTVDLVAEDAAGNESQTVSSTVIVDTLDPVLSLTSLTDGALEGTTSRLTGTIDGTGAPIVALAYQVNDGQVFNLSFNQTTGAFDSALNLATLAAGDHTVSILASDAAGNAIRQDIPLTLAEAIPFVLTELLPAEGAGEVGSTFRPEVHFSRPVDPDTLTADTFFLSDAAGNKLAANVKLSADGLKAWLFPAEAMPGASKIALTLDGDNIKALDGTPLDGDADGTDGGDLLSSFTTVSTTAVAGTTLSGYIVDPGDDLKPMTVDDYSAGPDGADFTDDDIFLNPIEGATVFILGLEHIKVETDENGYFELTNVPAGNVKVAVDGRTATNAPDGIFWPEMVMDANVIAGQANTLMGSMGSTEERLVKQARGEVYLPRVPTDALQDVSDTETTEIGMTVSSAEDLTAEQRDAVSLVLQPGTIVDENGNPVEDAQVGISTVPPELVMDMLPAGLMQHTFDLTIQAPDAAVFTTPAQLTLPNIFEAAPGTKLNLLSFDHTTGRLVIEGTATVSADGKTVVSDPDTGITKPGWHGMTPPGNPECLDIGGPPPENRMDPETPDDCDGWGIGISALGLAAGIGAFAAGGWVAVGLGAAATGLGLLNSYRAGELDDLGAVSTSTGVLGGVADLIGALDDAASVTNVNLSARNAARLGAFSDAAGVIGIGLGGWDLGTRIDQWFGSGPSSSGAVSEFSVSALDTASIEPDFSSLNSTTNWLEQKILAYDAAAKALNSAWAELYGDALVGIIGETLATDIISNYFAVQDGEYFEFASRETGERAKDAVDSSILRVSVQELIEAINPEIEDNLDNFENYFLNLEAVVNTVKDLAEGMTENQSDFVEAFEQPISELIDERGLYARPDGTIYYLFTDLRTGQIVARGQSTDGLLDAFLPPDTEVLLSLFDPVRKAFANHTVFSGPSGSNQIDVLGLERGEGLPLFFLTGEEVDTDGDGLVDIAEEVIGTDKLAADTDGDGISDKSEIDQGLNPLGDFPTSTGPIGSLQLSGTIISILVSDGIGDLTGPHALAITSTGFSLVDLNNQREPTVVAQRSDLGSLVDAALDTVNDRLLTLDSTGRASLWDMSDPTEPQKYLEISLSGQRVEFVGELAVVSESNRLKLFDPVNGTLVDQVTLPTGANLSGLGRDGDTLYAFDQFSNLHVIQVLNDAFALGGSTLINMQAGSFREIFAADGIVYVPASNSQNGYATVDVSDPLNPFLVGYPAGVAIGGEALAINGSGGGLLVGQPFGLGGTNVVDFVDTSNPSDTGDLITRFELPNSPTAVVIAGGVGYVGDASGNLHVVNYAPFDVNGIAPTADFDTLPEDVDPDTPGIQVLEGSRLRLEADVSDDIQVREVELLLNGQALLADLQYPFSFDVVLPELAEGSDGLNTIQIRATDTGGNVGLSQEISFELVSDKLPPQVVAVTPNNGVVFASQGSASFLFDETVDPATVLPGAASLRNLDDGTVIPATGVVFSAENKRATFTFGALTEGPYELALDLTGIGDPAGNTNITGTSTIELRVFDLPETTNIVLGTELDDNMNRSIFGSPGDDAIFTFEGNDWIFASTGQDILDAGVGFDDLIFGGAFQGGVIANNTSQEVDGVAPFTIDTKGLGNFQILNFESLNLTYGDDIAYFERIVGVSTQSFDNGGNDIINASQDPLAEGHNFWTGSGNDILFGTPGNGDTLHFLTEFDRLGDAFQGVSVTYSGEAQGTAVDAYGFLDEFTDVETVRGTFFDDWFAGSTGRQQFFGGDGNDYFVASVGDDYYDGEASGDEGDTIDYSLSATNSSITGGLIINNTGIERDGVAAFTTDKGVLGTDTVYNIENIRGSDFDDVIYLDGKDITEDELYVRDGGGDDVVTAFAHPDPDTSGVDFIVGSGSDTFIGTGTFLSQLSFSDWGDDSAGAQIQGAVATFTSERGGNAVDPWGFSDTFQNFTRLTGSEFRDIFTGSDGAQRLEGRDGDDDLFGLDGNDRLKGGFGTDLLNGGGDDDELTGGEGADTLIGGSGFDRLDYNSDWEDGAFQGILVDFDASTVVDGFGFTDSFSEIEGIFATFYDDIINASNVSIDLEIDAAGGNDIIDTGSGNDRVYAGDGNDEGSLGAGDDELRISGGFDVFDGGAGTDRVRVDLRDLPNDFAVIYDFQTGVGGEIVLGSVVDFDAPAIVDNRKELTNFERFEVQGTQDAYVRGSDLRDRIRLDSGNDFVTTLDGDDSVSTGAGDDTIESGLGFDYIEPGSGVDFIDGGDAIGDEGATISYAYDHQNDWDLNGAQGTILVDFTSEFAGTVQDWNGDADTFQNISGIQGTAWDDVFIGTVGRQRFYGFIGNDLLDGGAGGRDQADYSDNRFHDEAYTGVVVVLDDGTGTEAEVRGYALDGYGTVDTLIDIEEARGTDRDDSLTGSGLDNFLEGGGGDDRLFGGAGDDDLEGGSGDDLLDPGNGIDFQYINPGSGVDIVDLGDVTAGQIEIDSSSVANPITVNLSEGSNSATVDKGADGTTTLLSANNALLADGLQFIGTSGDDIFDFDVISEDAEVTVRSGQGNDTFNLSQTGDFRLRLDRDVKFSNLATQGVVIDLTLSNNQIVNDGFGFTDDINGGSFSEIRLTHLADSVSGTAGDESFSGQGGDDILQGGAGSDYFQGGEGNDTIDGGTAAPDDFDFISYYWDIERALEDGLGGLSGVNVVFSNVTVGTAIVSNDGFGTSDNLTAIEGLEGTRYSDTIIGGIGDDFLRGLEGNDVIDGGVGIADWAAYSNTVNKGGNQGIYIDFVNSVFKDTFGDQDTLTNIENILGSDFDDEIIGDNSIGRRLVGRGGDDTIAGGSLNDTLEGGDDNDSLFGNAGEDSFDGGRGDDQLESILDGQMDVFIFREDSGTDTISGWEAGIDKLDISEFAVFADAVIDQTSGVDTTIVIGDVVLKLEGFVGVIDETSFL
ncbi:Ca2+-binding RTX toxin-like protein [Labrenzia sp. EL_13]|nr:Ca2+-binding RTX toxin-like protein [Labrenzia sp. EL_13]